MSELMLSPTPTPPPGMIGNASAPGQGDAASRPESGAQGGTGLPFAAELKSRMDKNSARTDKTDSADIPAQEPPVDAAYAQIVIDLSALLPFSGINPVAANQAPVAVATEAGTDEALPAGLAAVAELAPASPIAAVSAAPVATPLPASAAPLPATLARAIDANARPQNPAASDTVVAAADTAKPGVANAMPGNMTPDAAITADAGGGEHAAPELAADSFRAVMDRASATPAAVAGAAGGSPATPNLRIDTPLGQAGWHDEMGQKLTWMVGNNRQQADLVLTPPQLGRIEVSLTINGDQATAVFTSANQSVREALESSLHRLREVLADAGVTLGQTHVGSESSRQSDNKNQPGFGTNEGVRYAASIPLPGADAVSRPGAGRGLIDVFA